MESYKVNAHFCECTGHTCQCCATIQDEHFRLNDTLCADAEYNLNEKAISADVTWNGNVIMSKTLSAVSPPPLCADVPIPNLEVFFHRLPSESNKVYLIIRLRKACMKKSQISVDLKMFICYFRSPSTTTFFKKMKLPQQQLHSKHQEPISCFFQGGNLGSSHHF